MVRAKAVMCAWVSLVATGCVNAKSATFSAATNDAAARIQQLLVKVADTPGYRARVGALKTMSTNSFLQDSFGKLNNDAIKFGDISVSHLQDQLRQMPNGDQIKRDFAQKYPKIEAYLSAHSADKSTVTVGDIAEMLDDTAKLASLGFGSKAFDDYLKKTDADDVARHLNTALLLYEIIPTDRVVDAAAKGGSGLGLDDNKGGVGGYTCLQQKAWGKCGQAWMNGCSEACNTSAGVQTLGGYTCDQQVAWHGCGTDFVKAGCSSCNTQSSGGSGSGGPSSNTVAPAAVEATGAAAQTNTLPLGGSSSPVAPAAPDCSIQCEADATAANYCVDGHWISVAAAASTGKCEAASEKGLNQPNPVAPQSN